MEKERLDRFKQLLSVPSKTYKETGMVNYILSVLEGIQGIEFYTDEMNNVYATKGTLNEGEYYPMFIAHTDTVHELVPEIVVKEEMLVKPNTFGRAYDTQEHFSLKGYTPKGIPTGIGGDDKNGIFIAIELLRMLPKVKIGLFVSEETGCHGSSKCDLDFLNDVGYAIQFDAPGNHLITEICSGTRLFKENGDFIKTVKPLFEQVMEISVECQAHPYTDVSQIKRKGDFSTINFSCGYYNMHTSSEFVVVDEVEKCIEFGVKIVDVLGYQKSEYEYTPPLQYNVNAYGYSNNLSNLNDNNDNEDSFSSTFNKFTYLNDILIIKDKFSNEEVVLYRKEIFDLIEFLNLKMELEEGDILF
jgi:putative aminopeptidase FrvX